MKRRIVEHRGAKLSVLDAGAGAPVLLLHAYPLTGELFRHQVAALAPKFRVIVPDLRGFGQSERGTDAPLEMNQLAEDAFAVLDALGVERAVVGGVSMGGYAAMAMLRHDAGRVAGLLLSDTQALADDEAARGRREDAARAALAGGMKGVAESMLPKLLAPEASAEVRREVERMILENRPESAAAAQRGMALRLDSKDMLARYAGPALVVVGEQDGLTPPERATQMADLLKGSTLVRIPLAGHLANLEQPKLFNAAVERFLTGGRGG